MTVPSSTETAATIVLPAREGPVLSIDKWATNAPLIADCARLGYLRPEWRTLDVTYGYGNFWTVFRPDELVGCDLNPEKSPIGYPVDYTALPFEPRSFAAVVFDPDYKLTGTAWNVGGMDERYGTDGNVRWQDRMANIRAGARECARVADKMLLVKCQDQVVSSKIRWQTRAIADEVEPLGFGLRARFDFLGVRKQPDDDIRQQRNPRAQSSQLLVFERGWNWSDLPSIEQPVLLPLEIVNELRQYAEALSAAEQWRPESHGSDVLRRVQDAIRVATSQRAPSDAARALASRPFGAESP